MNVLLLNTLLPSVLAAGAAPDFFTDVAIIVLSAAAVAYVCQRLGLMPIVGFLLAGVLIGPSALGLVADRALIDACAEVGVVLLLFTIGIEFSLEKLSRIKRLIFGGGGLQVTLTTGAVAGLLAAFGVDWPSGVFTGFLVALSSTAIVLKLLASRGEMNTPYGQSSVGLLIFQDLAIVAMVLAVPMLGDTGGSASTLSLLLALAKALAIVAGVLVVARRVMPIILEAVARTCSHEIFLLTVIAICFGTAYATSLAGLSLSLGAFLAGLLVSESDFSEHALGEILPLQTLFSAAFFVSVGMLLDLYYLADNLGIVLAALGTVLVLKVGTTMVSTLALGYPFRTSLCTGLILAQVGEFSFVLERAGREAGLSPAGLGEAGAQTFIAATVVLMLLTPFLVQLGVALKARLRRRAEARQAAGLAGPSGGDGQPVFDAHGAAHDALDDHVLIAGYGTGGQRLAAALQDAKVPFVILTLSPEAARAAEAEGWPVLRGDYARRHILEQAGLARARLLVVPDDQPPMVERVTAVARTLRPDLRVVTRTRFAEEARALTHAGAEHVVTEEHESTASLLEAILTRYDLAPYHIERHTRAVRHGLLVPAAGGDGVAPLEDRPQAEGLYRLRPDELRSPHCSHTGQTEAVRPRTPDGCEECLRTDDTWVHLRLCMTCGHVGCCDSSKNKHAAKHAHETGHPIVKSFEPDEDWSWCYLDETRL